MELKHINQLKTSLAVISEKIDGVNEHLKNLNGKSQRNAENIEELKLSETAIKGSISGAKWVGGIAITVIVILISTITGVTLYAYQGDKKALYTRTENVTNELSRFQTQQSDQFNKIINLLSDKEVVSKIKK